MPGILRVRVRAARDLPVMEKSSQSTDAYVEVRLKDVSFKSAVCWRSLNPTWDTAVFEFEVMFIVLAYDSPCSPSRGSQHQQ
eukprot:m.122021 g.122021  ORF g.122021 m.122021 type:complete len:82 (+) comp14590_c0_seq1:147-392(+)